MRLTGGRAQTDERTDAPTADVAVDRGTAADSENIARNIVRQSSFLRSEIRMLDGDAIELHRQAQAHELDIRTVRMCKQAATDLLQRMYLAGFSWTDVAQLLKVSLAAVRKWRKGDSLSGQHFRALGRAVAFLELLETHGVEDPAAWMEMPLVESHPIRGIDVYVDLPDGWALLLDMAAGHELEPAVLLDSADPEWRIRYPSPDHKVIHTDEGPVITPRD